MLIGKLDASLLETLLQGKTQLELMKAWFEQDIEHISDAAYWRISLCKVKNGPYIIWKIYSMNQ